MTLGVGGQMDEQQRDGTNSAEATTDAEAGQDGAADAGQEETKGADDAKE